MAVSLMLWLMPLFAQHAGEYAIPLEQKLEVLKIQREQNRTWAEREKARADMLDAQNRLDAANARMNRKQDELRRLLKCIDCEVREMPDGDLKLIKPMPDTVTVTPSRAEK